MKICKFWDRLGRYLVGLSALALMAGGTGLVINHVREKPLPLIYQSKDARFTQAIETMRQSYPVEDPAKPQSDPKPVVQIISLDEFKDCVARTDSAILDARPEFLHRLGHVPHALSLPRNNFEAAYAKLRSQLEKDKNQRLVVYCSDVDCEDSQMVADALLKLGFRKVSLFKGGWADWTAAHLPEEKSP